MYEYSELDACHHSYASRQHVRLRKSKVLHSAYSHIPGSRLPSLPCINLVSCPVLCCVILLESQYSRVRFFGGHLMTRQREEIENAQYDTVYKFASVLFYTHIS